MIKHIKEEDTKFIKINVRLKNGKEYLGKDLGAQTFGDHGTVVGFWDDEFSMLIFPLNDVEEISFYIDKPEVKQS